jgi:hypothetical protein
MLRRYGGEVSPHLEFSARAVSAESDFLCGIFRREQLHHIILSLTTLTTSDIVLRSPTNPSRSQKTARHKMADMDTYHDEQRGYEGNYTLRRSLSHKSHGYNGHSEIDLPDINITTIINSSIPDMMLTRTDTDDRDYGRERSRSPGPDRDGDTRIRDEPMNGRADR